jgi:hypothetical protein
MSWSTTVRRLGAVAAIAALTSAAAAPAYAQADPVTLDVFLADAAVPAGGSNDRIDFTIQANQTAEVENLTLAFDTSGLAGVATIDVPDSDCTASATEVICTESFPTDVNPEPVSLFDVAITADPGALAGDTGTVELTAMADGAEPGSHTATVTIGAPVDLVASDNASLTASIGETLPLPWTVQNAGTEPAEGVALLISSHIGVSQQQYSNCVYYPNIFVSDQPGSGLCTFDVVLEPGNHDLDGRRGRRSAARGRRGDGAARAAPQGPVHRMTAFPDPAPRGPISASIRAAGGAGSGYGAGLRVVLPGG